MATTHPAIPRPLDEPVSAGDGYRALADHLSHQREELADVLVMLRMAEAPSWTSWAGTMFRRSIGVKRDLILAAFDLLDSAVVAAAVHVRRVDEEADRHLAQELEWGDRISERARVMRQADRSSPGGW